MKYIPTLAAISLLLGLSSGLGAQQVAGHEHAAGAHSNERLGTVSFPNSGNSAAQTSFLRGLALLHSFEYEDAGEAFRAAQRADPAFAVAYWGEALTYAKLLWGLDNPEATRVALARLASTPEERLRRAPTERERAYGAAVEALYQGHDLESRIRGYVAGLRALTSKYPDDLEARALLAIALQMRGAGYSSEEQRERTIEAITLAESIFKSQPDHPGGAHYLIHAADNPELAARGVAAARAYAKIAPDAEHALHMPSHIFVQIGAWDDVVSSNERAWAASRGWVRSHGVPNTELSFHTLSWLEYGYLQQGRYAAAHAVLDTIAVVLKGVDWSRADADSLGGHRSAIDARYALDLSRFSYARETGDWTVFGGKAPAPVPPSNSASDRASLFAMQGAYTRAFTAGMLRDTITAKALPPFTAKALPHPSFADAGLPGTVARAHVSALTARARGDIGAYLASLRDAADADAQMAHAGPPIFVPAHELLGQALLEAGRFDEAVKAFEKSLQLMPNRSASLLGLARAHWNAGNRDASRQAYKKLRANWHSADRNVRALKELGR